MRTDWLTAPIGTVTDTEINVGMAVQRIDEYLAEIGQVGRTVVDAGQVVDVLLDVRSLVAAIDEPVSVP